MDQEDQEQEPSLAGMLTDLSGAKTRAFLKKLSKEALEKQTQAQPKMK